MKRPSPEDIDAYCKRFDVAVEVAWRDFLQLRLAEGASRDKTLKALCVWKGAFVMRFALGSIRASGDLDATVGTNKDKIDPQQIRIRLMKACEDIGIVIPKASAPDPGDESVSFEPIEWRDPDLPQPVRTSIDLSMREDLVLPPVLLRIDAGLVPPFEVLHIDLHEQAAEKMRCLVQRTRVGDGMDVMLLREHARLSDERVRAVTAMKLTSGQDHRARARERVQQRYEAWDNQIGRELPRNAPTKNEMRDACLAAIEKWIPK